MPELKRTFTGGKMEKDLDERIVPNGQYREALNIGVATSEDSDVGAAQNILGNIKVTSAISSRTISGGVWGEEHINQGTGKQGWNYHIAEIVDPQTDMLYRFIHTPNSDEGLWMDRIVEYNTSKSLDTAWGQKESAVMVDIFKVTAKITHHDCMCPASNKAMIKVSRNLYQLRWGMKVQGGAGECNMGDDVTIEQINYVTGWITLSRAIWVDPTPPTIPPTAVPCDDCSSGGQPCCNRSYFSFIGDRNLNFSPDRSITGINIIDGMIFWTDDYSEPKKLSIQRGKAGSDGDFRDNGELGRSQLPISDFNQHTLLMVTRENELRRVDTCTKDESFCPPVGCMDDGMQPWSLYPGPPPIPSLTFDPLAIYHDQTMCCYFDGCTDDSVDQYGDYIYCNYDPNACQDDGSCCAKCGCMDDGSDPNYPGRPANYPVNQNACNYDNTVCHDDGSCVYGDCMDPDASNYNSGAECDVPDMCEWKYSCVDSGYATNSCTDQYNQISNQPSTQAWSGPNFYTDYWPSNNNTYDLGVGPPDNPEGSTWVNTGNNIKWASENGAVYTHSDDGSGSVNVIQGFSGGAWIYSDPTNANQDIGTISFEKQVSGVPWNCPTPTSFPSCYDGHCTYPIDENDYSLGYKVNMRTKAIIIEKVWQQIDGLDYKTWNGTTKGGYVWAYDAGSNSWISSQSNPSHQIFGNYGAFTSLIDPVTGHPLPGWFAFGLIPGQNPATGGGGIFGYEDIYGNIWGGSIGGYEPIGFAGKVCFGLGCPTNFNGTLGATTLIGSNSPADLMAGNPYTPVYDNSVIQGGTTYQDMINWLRVNGYDGDGPSIDHNKGGNICDTCGSEEHEKLMNTYHGLGAALGTETIANFEQCVNQGGTGCGSFYNPNGPNVGYDASWNTQQWWGSYPNYHAQYNYGTFPSITYGDTLVELWRKVTNNGIGWVWGMGGDMPGPPALHFLEDPCECDGWNSSPGCEVDPNGIYDSLYDCENCVSCACNPVNVSYNCLGTGGCQQVAGFGGTFASLSACQSFCGTI